MKLIETKNKIIRNLRTAKEHIAQKHASGKNEKKEIFFHSMQNTGYLLRA